MTWQSVGQLQREIERIIDYSRTENKLTRAEIVGALEIVKFNILCESASTDTREEEGESNES